jgi:protein phosphatase PTC1
LADTQGSSSGCTAVTAFLRLEDEDGNPVAHPETSGVDRNSRSTGEVNVGGVAGKAGEGDSKVATASKDEVDGEAAQSEKVHGSSSSSSESGGILGSITRKIRHGSTHSSSTGESGEGGGSKGAKNAGPEANMGEDGLMQVKGKQIKRVLYTANVGDARAVLW